MKIQLMRPVITNEMITAAQDALQNEYIQFGESVYKFEEEFAKFIGTKYAIGVSSGTFALSLSLEALGLKPNEKVLTSPMSFIATSNAILHAKGIPEFSDISEKTGNLDVENMKMSKDIKGIIPVHLYGNPCPMKKIKEFKEEGYFIVEDACQAHGATIDGKKVGSIGDVGCFSFYSVKNMTVGGDGGMITTDNEEIAEKIRILRDCGRISKYEHSMIGYTARLNTINAAIGRVQLKMLSKWNENRRKAAKIYKKYLPKDMYLEENGKSVYHIFILKTKERGKIRNHLDKNGIQTGIHYPIPIHLQPIYIKMFNYKDGDFPKAEKFAKNIVSLPMFPEITDEQVKYVCEKILEVIE